MTSEITILAVDLAIPSFQTCAVGPDGAVVFNRTSSRTRSAALLANQPACAEAVEACGA